MKKIIMKPVNKPTQGKYVASPPPATPVYKKTGGCGCGKRR
ncbi:hypothetical protein ACSVDA_01975 [Cytobacillus sp. Hm23]